VPAEQVYTRRTVAKRSHGQPGDYVDLQYKNGVWVGFAGGGSEDPVTVAIDLALRQAELGGRIKKDGKIGRTGIKLSNQHVIIAEYRRRTDSKHGKDHFVGSLAQAHQEGRIGYQRGTNRQLAGYGVLERQEGAVVVPLRRPTEEPQGAW